MLNRYTEQLRTIKQELSRKLEYPMLYVALLSLLFVLSQSVEKTQNPNQPETLSAAQLADDELQTFVHDVINQADHHQITAASAITPTNVFDLNLLEPWHTEFIGLPVNEQGEVRYVPPLTTTVVLETEDGITETIVQPVRPMITVIDSGGPLGFDQLKPGPFHHVTSSNQYSVTTDLDYAVNTIFDPSLAGCPDGVVTDMIDGDSFPEDKENHGSEVAATALKVADRNTRILHLRVLGANNQGTTNGIAAAIRVAADCEPTIINLSLGAEIDFNQTLNDAVQYAYSQEKILFAGAGNYARRERFIPAAFDNVYGVAAARFLGDQQWEWWQLNNTHPDNTSIIAPSGFNVRSFDRHSALSLTCCTSAATPVVSGVAATLLSRVPEGVPFSETDLMTALQFYRFLLADTPEDIDATQLAVPFDQPFMTEQGDVVYFFETQPKRVFEYYLPLVQQQN